VSYISLIVKPQACSTCGVPVYCSDVIVPTCRGIVSCHGWVVCQQDIVSIHSWLCTHPSHARQLCQLRPTCYHWARVQRRTFHSIVSSFDCYIVAVCVLCCWYFELCHWWLFQL